MNPSDRREAAAAIRSRCRFGLDAAAASVFLAQPLTAVLLPGGYRLPDVVLRAAAIIGGHSISWLCVRTVFWFVILHSCHVPPQGLVWPPVVMCSSLPASDIRTCASTPSQKTCCTCCLCIWRCPLPRGLAVSRRVGAASHHNTNGRHLITHRPLRTCPQPPGILLLARRILTFRRWRDEHAQVTRFLCCFLLMMAELTVENCVVWWV